MNGLPTDPWAAHPARRREAPTANNSALCLLHETGSLHIRTFYACATYVTRVLVGAGYDVVPELRESDDLADCIYVNGLRFRESFRSGQVRTLAELLRDAGVVAHAYAFYYDLTGRGPDLKYRRLGDPPRTPDYRMLHSVDLGNDAGRWFFGHPRQLERALTMAPDGAVTYAVRGWRGDLHSFAVNAYSPAGDEVARRFNDDGHVWTDTFR